MEMGELLMILLKIGAFIYAYCTDFIINLANLTGLSYYEINALIFCFLWPLTTFGLLIFYITQRLKLHKNMKSKYIDGHSCTSDQKII
jgi:hypothetical protein